MATIERPLIPIGRFAEACRLSHKALRLYDAVGLLRPARVDPETGYRYYAEDQLRAARIIGLLRRLQMPLATIRQILAAPDAEAAEILDQYWREVEARIADGRKIVAYAREYLQGRDELMAHEVQVRDVRERKILSIRDEVFVNDLPGFIGRAFRQLYTHVTAKGGRVTGPGIVIYHGEVNEDSNGPVEVCVPAEGAAGTNGIRSSTLPAGQVAYATITLEQCHFPEIIQAYDAVHQWIKNSGREMAAPPREVYFVEDERTIRPDEPYCDVEWPFR